MAMRVTNTTLVCVFHSPDAPEHGECAEPYQFDTLLHTATRPRSHTVGDHPAKNHDFRVIIRHSSLPAPYPPARGYRIYRLPAKWAVIHLLTGYLMHHGKTSTAYYHWSRSNTQNGGMNGILRLGR
jgi:hypothetical protein